MSPTVHYGYTDASGDYYITIGAACDGCAKCVEVCPEGVLEMITDDYGGTVAAVKEAYRRDLNFACSSCKPISGSRRLECQHACPQEVVSHSW
jgi:ferredoxin